MPSNGLPHFLQALYRHRRRRAQFLREQLHAQFLQHPAELLDLQIRHALLRQQDRAASQIVRRIRRVLKNRQDVEGWRRLNRLF